MARNRSALHPLSSWLVLIQACLGGTDYGIAEASDENAETFFQEGACAALGWGYNVFLFEAFDEPWKPESIGDTGKVSNEKHWGFYTTERGPKFSTKCKWGKS